MSHPPQSPTPFSPTPAPTFTQPLDSLSRLDSATPFPGDDAPSQLPLDPDALALGSAPPEQRISYYVQAADEMLASVLEKEDFLFDEAELGALMRFTGLSYEARCLFMRLYLRKHQWLRVNQLRYERDIKDLEGAVRALCSREGEEEAVKGEGEGEGEDGVVKGEGVEEVVKAQGKTEEPVASTSKARIEVLELSSDVEEDVKPAQIDLTLSDSDDEDEKPKPTTKRSPTPPPPPPVAEEPPGPDYSALAHDTSWLSTAEPAELFKLLSLDEIVTLGKKMKADPGKGKNTRQDWIAALLKTSSQSTLFFLPSPRPSAAPPVKLKGKAKHKPPPTPRALFGVAKGTAQNAVVTRHALALIGNVIRLSPDWIALFNRVSLVYHRTGYESTNRATAFTASLLARFGKRHYPEYDVARSFAIFPSRAVLLEFEDALKLERQLEEILDDTWGVAVPSSRTAKSGPKSKARYSTEQERKEDLEKIRIPKWREGVAIMEGVWDRWLGMCEEQRVKAEEGEEKGELVYFRSRFHPGWPITRIVYKASALYGRLKEHDREVAILRALLAQKAFRRGKRGAWYDRLALVIGHYPNQQEQDATDPEVKEQLKTIRLEEALEVCFRGLNDPLTHLVYRSGLERRVKRLESLLKRPMTERSAFPGLDKAEERVIVGERLDDEVDRRVMGRHSVWRGEKVKKEEVEEADEVGAAGAGEEGGEPTAAVEVDGAVDAIKLEAVEAATQEQQATQDSQLTQPAPSNTAVKAMEVDVDDDDELGPEVRVEQVALEAYAKEGWKGYHSEGGIVTTIWGLLMWDVIFAPVDGAFETAYQSEPLDLRTDSFAVVRRDLIEERLKDIERGQAVEILTAVDERERPKGTFCVGVRWDSYPLDDIVEIVHCLGTSALVTICRMLSEEYGHRTGGLPDLCLWNFAQRKILFSEVKGPGDVLSETQRVWIDVLLSCGVPVEVAKVVTQEGYEKMMEVKEGKKRKGKGGKAGGGGKGRKKTKVESESEEEVEEVAEEEGSEVEVL